MQWTRSGNARRELHVRAAYMELQLLQQTHCAVRQRDAGGELRGRRELEPLSDAVRPPVEPQQHLLIFAPDAAGKKDGMVSHRLEQGAARVATNSGSIVPRAAVLAAIGHGANAPERARERLHRTHTIIAREHRESGSSVEVQLTCSAAPPVHVTASSLRASVVVLNCQIARRAGADRPEPTESIIEDGPPSLSRSD